MRSDRTPERRIHSSSSRAALRAGLSEDAGDTALEAGSPSAKKGWGSSLVGGAMNAGVYGAALGV
jgi:hypothetical protein